MWSDCVSAMGDMSNGQFATWALWMIAVAVGFSLGLTFRAVGAISRSVHPTLWPRGSKGSPWFGPDQVRAELAFIIPPM